MPADTYVHPIAPDKHRAGQAGITLRNHIAVSVYPTIIANLNGAPKKAGAKVDGDNLFAEAASMAVEAADALLAALGGAA